MLDNKEELVSLLESQDFERFNELVKEADGKIDFSETDFSGMTLELVNFVNMDLNGCNFQGATLSEVDFSSSDLTSANFSRSELKEVKFNNAILNGTHFDSASILSCDYADADTSGADFSNSDLTGSDFTLSVNLEQCKFDTDTIWPDSDQLPEDFDTKYIHDLSEFNDDEDEVTSDSYYD